MTRTQKPAPEAPVEFIDLAVTLLRDRANDRDLEGSPAAGVYRRIAMDLLVLWEKYHDTPLSMADAVAWSGYSEQGVRAWMRRTGAEFATRRVLPRHGARDVEQHIDVSVQPLSPETLSKITAELLRAG